MVTWFSICCLGNICQSHVIVLQLVLVNGKKVDPIPFETALNSASKETGISEAVVFGVNRAQIGVLVILAPNQQPEDVRLRAWSVIESINSTVSRHARISSPDMIVALGSEIVFPKSSKGTLQRPLIYQRYQKVIDKVYEILDAGSSNGPKKILTSLEEIQSYTLQVIREVLASGTSSKYGREGNLSQETDLFGYGVDSLQSARIRNRLQAELEFDGKELPSNIVFEQGDARRLATFLFSMISGQDYSGLCEDEISLMQSMVAKYQLAGTGFPGVSGEKISCDPHSRVLVCDLETVPITADHALSGPHWCNWRFRCTCVKSGPSPRETRVPYGVLPVSSRG